MVIFITGYLSEAFKAKEDSPTILKLTLFIYKVIRSRIAPRGLPPSHFP